MQVFINNNARFCCQSKEKVLSSNTFRRNMKIKMENLIDDDLEKSSSDEPDNEDDNNFIDEAEFDNNNDECNE